MSVKKQFLKGFETSSACMSQQKGYRLLKEESLSHTQSSLLHRVQNGGLHPFCPLSVCPSLPNPAVLSTYIPSRG